MTGKRRLGVLGLIVAGAVVVAVLFSAPALTEVRTINEAILQGRAWVFGPAQTFNAGVKTPAGQQTAWTTFTPAPLGTFNADFTTANPTVPPTITAQLLTIGTCQNGVTYRAYYSYVTPTGETLLTAASNDWTYTGGNNTGRLTVQRIGDTPPPLATAWAIYYSRSTDGHVIRRIGNIALATTSTNLSCTAGSGPPTGINSTGVAQIGTLLSDSWRMAKYTAGTPGTLTQDVYRFNLRQGYVSVSDDGNVTESALMPEAVNTRRVCSECRYTTCAAAVASITDASYTKRYTIIMSTTDGSDSCTIPAYTSVVGESRYSTVVSSIDFPVDSFEAGVANLTVTGHISFGTSGGSRRNNYAVNVTVGNRDLSAGSADSFIDNSGLAPVNFWLVNSDAYSAQDIHNYGQHFAYVGLGNYFHTKGTVGNARSYRLTGPLMNIQEFNSVIRITQTVSDDIPTAIVTWNDLGSLSSPQVAPLIRFYNVQAVIDQQSTDSTIGTSALISIDDPVATTPAGVIDLRKFDGTFTTASAAETINGIRIANDAGADGWTVNIADSRIILSGGAARNDVANERAGVTVTLDKVEHAGNYTGAGNVVVKRSPLTNGVLRDDGLASKPASCRVGDTYTDTTGGAVALCLCTVSGTPGTWEAQGAGTCN